MKNYKLVIALAFTVFLTPLSLMAQDVQFLLPKDNDLGRISSFSEGLARVYISYDSVGFINTQGEFAFDETFKDAGRFHPGRAWVMKEVEGEEQYGYINKNGQLVIPYVYDKALDFSCGRAVVKKDGKWVVIDRSGNVVINSPYLVSRQKLYSYGGDVSYEPIKPPAFHSNRMLVKRNGKFGYVNLNGKVVIPFQYAIAEDFSEGVAVVKVKRPGNPQPYRWQVIDTTGQVLFTFEKGRYPVFDVGFSNGLLPFKDYRGSDKRYGFINKHGKVVIGPRSFDHPPFVFSDSVCIIQVDGQRRDNKDGYMLILNTKGEVVSKVPFCGEYGCMVDSNREFHEGLLAVKVKIKNKGMRWGYIDKHGNYVIPPKFDLALDFHNGRAVVRTQNGRMNYIKNPLRD